MHNNLYNLRPQGDHPSVLSVLRSLVRHGYDAVRMYEYQWMPANASVEVPEGRDFQSPSDLDDMIRRGLLLRPAFPWTRMYLSPSGKLTCGGQPYMTALRPDRFDYWGAHVPAVAARDGEDRARSYRFADLEQELTCDHFSRHDFWPDHDSAEFYGIKFVGSDVTVAEGCPGKDFPDKPLQVTFGRNTGFLADIWDSCLQGILDSNGTRIRAC